MFFVFTWLCLEFKQFPFAKEQQFGLTCIVCWDPKILEAYHLTSGETSLKIFQIFLFSRGLSLGIQTIFVCENPRVGKFCRWKLKSRRFKTRRNQTPNWVHQRLKSSTPLLRSYSRRRERAFTTRLLVFSRRSARAFIYAVQDALWTQ